MRDGSYPFLTPTIGCDTRSAWRHAGTNPTWKRHDFCEHSAGGKDRRVCELWVQFLCRCGETRGVFPGRKGFGRCGVDEREMMGKRAKYVGAMVGVGAGNPLRAVCHIRYSLGRGGPGQVLSGPTRGPDKVRFKNNSQIRYTGAKFGLERGSGFGSCLLYTSPSPRD